MSEFAIEISNLYKQYNIGKAKSSSLREAMRSFWSKEKVEHFWALQDLNLKIKTGEAIGVIGKNGAGKSTLLKILSKITYPTKGQIIINGRVSSLLEVGTGFHPELTGRENIFLNGTILGMTRSEIKTKFEDIVEFSGVSAFIDTPIKHYSSGMKVRLAFSVAAHLEPEILIIDEVLAVGDADFQKRCLGKMEDIAGQGRTVIFVSHNMGAVRHLCSRGVFLANGQLVFEGNQNEAIEQYLQEQQRPQNLMQTDQRKGNGNIEIWKIVLTKESGASLDVVRSGERFDIEFHYKVTQKTPLDRIIITLHILNQQEDNIFMIHNRMTNQPFRIIRNDGKFCCTIKKLPLPPGAYKIGYSIIRDNEYIDAVENAFKLDVVSGEFYNSIELPTSSQAMALIDASWRQSETD